MAAALANVDDRDNWRVHFADTMRGGQYVNNWRMAELHAKEAPDRVRELEAWGAVFDRTKDGRILQRNFGGHRYPRLAHVGDRTGLEMIRTLQDHGIHQGIDVHMECTIVSLLKDGDRVVGAFGYEREHGRFKIFHAKAVVLATGGIGRAYKITSNSWECTGDGHSLAYHAGAELIDMEFIQFHPDRHGLAAERARACSSPKACAAKAACCETRTAGGSCSTTSRTTTQPDRRQRRGRLALHAGRQDCAAPARAADARSRRALHHARSEGRPRQPARRRVPRYLLDQGKAPERGRAHQAKAAEHVSPVQAAGRHRHHDEPMEVGPTTHYIMGGVRVDGDTQMSNVPGLFAAGECAAGINGANRLGGNSLSDLLVFGKRAGEYAAQVCEGERRTARSTTMQVERLRAARRWRPSSAASGEKGRTRSSSDLQELMQDIVGIVRNEEEMATALETLQKLWERAAKPSVSPAIAITTPAGTPRSI